MNKEILIFNDIVIDKRKFHYSKNPIFIDNVDIDKILILKDFFWWNGSKMLYWLQKLWVSEGIVYNSIKNDWISKKNIIKLSIFSY